ncbi:MAG: tRNA (N6-threonylcarbamoyladenosine(37)-N6)-methyltransferase TrmO [Clostridia bacterium]|nr:tRNA (N6-threonylcarbamoyladenosine(37)-N6)-methyltransferase TrmO [Clostridia bacterium]
MEIEKIAQIKTDFPTKFGIPRQSGIVKRLRGKIIFEPKYNSADAIRGIEGFSHLWIVWGFSENESAKYNATVRPPRLGGNTRIGVFASRSPFRPNGLGLSLVKLEKIEKSDKHGHILVVSGVDMVDATPIYDIKPYLPGTDYAEDAVGGFAEKIDEYRLEVKCDRKLLSVLDEERAQILLDILAEDPRPSYIDDPDRVYGFPYAGHEIKFKVEEKCLTVISIE